MLFASWMLKNNLQQNSFFNQTYENKTQTMNSDALKLLIKDSKRTKRLDLSHQNLDEVPEEVVNVHHLEKLILSNNQIREIPNKLITSK